MIAKSLSILLVGGSNNEQKKITETLYKLDIENDIYLARDGLEALDILRGKKSGVSLAAPYIIILDQALTNLNGIELLCELQSDPGLHDSIVFVMTDSVDAMNINGIGEYKISGYLNKNDISAGFKKSIELLFT